MPARRNSPRPSPVNAAGIRRLLNQALFATTLLLTAIALPGCATTGKGLHDSASPYGTLPTIKGRALIEFEEADFKAKATVIIKGSSKVRIDILGPLGTTVALLRGSGGPLSVEAGDGGNLNELPLKVWRWLTLLDSTMLVELLRGPGAEGGSRHTGTFDLHAGTFDLDDGSHEWVVGGRSKTFLARYSDYREQGGVRAPYRVSIRTVEQRETAGVTYRVPHGVTGKAAGPPSSGEAELKVEGGGPGSGPKRSVTLRYSSLLMNEEIPDDLFTSP